MAADLDVHTMRSLEEALLDFGGCVLVVRVISYMNSCHEAFRGRNLETCRLRTQKSCSRAHALTSWRTHLCCRAYAYGNVRCAYLGGLRSCTAPSISCLQVSHDRFFLDRLAT